MLAGKIELTGVPLEAIVRAAYAPSRPQGLGFMHYQEGDLTDEEVAEIIARARVPTTAVSMDYVKGRSVKMHVHRDKDGRLTIGNRWYDHSDSELRSFLSAIGLSPDLLDKARAEEAAHLAAVIEEAQTFLQKEGGSFIEKDEDRRAGKELPSRLEDGLIYGAEEGGPIIATWVDGGRQYSLRTTKK